jgi:hypothetical protein
MKCKSAKRRTGIFLLVAAFTGLIVGLDAAPPPAASPFGQDKPNSGEAALIGIFYDMKQTADRKPVNMDLGTYCKTIEDFVNGGWDESILDKYYQVSTPRYTTQIYVPVIASEMAPLAFGVQNWVKGGFWLVHYKAQVTPPHDGTYRFVGWADCQIEVAVNQKLVEEKGASYQKDSAGFPILPVLQVAPYQIPPSAPGTVFPTAPNPVVWTALQ